jgi:ATP-dependent Lon protease
MKPEEKQQILEDTTLVGKLQSVANALGREIALLEMKSKIETAAQQEMTDAQRQYYLRQQLKAIQDELGEGEKTEIQELRTRLAEAKLPEPIMRVAERELERLERMTPSSPEYQMIRTYFDWLLDIAWSTVTEDRLDPVAARQVLDEDHYDLDKVKERIVEYLAVQKLKMRQSGAAAQIKGPILCFVGPPGVGKTSLGQSIARAMNRKFVRISLGGVRDEAEIRGHRRTYVGSLPGRIIQGIKKAGTNNPVFVLDEIDKLGHDFRGDPASALLEVLDPEQNSSFSDHYLEVTFDLSRVLFIATANQLDPIPWALRDRLEIIELPGYTRQEKKMIARKFLVPKQLDDHGLTNDRCEITDEALFEIVDSYTREAGVRNLEREIGSVCRAVAVKVAEGQAKDHEVIDPKVVEEVLGPKKFVSEVAERVGEPGVATGLAWTAVGGDILFIEATQMPGKGKLTLTGQLGDVMKESVTAALSFVRGRAAALGLDSGNFLENKDLHVHVPAGAVPKDGPSAGVTMYTALVSLLTGVPVRPDVAMTGEITLRGNVLQIGGLKEKLLAAHRAGIHRVIIPDRNVKDLIDVPDEVKREMEILSVKRMDEVLALALKDPPPSIVALAKAAQLETQVTA